MVVREVIPRVPVGAVVFANGSLVTFAEVGSAFLPMGLRLPVLVEANALSGKI